jgi:hypothetical protein
VFLKGLSGRRVLWLVVFFRVAYGKVDKLIG